MPQSLLGKVEGSPQQGYLFQRRRLGWDTLGDFGDVFGRRLEGGNALERFSTDGKVQFLIAAVVTITTMVAIAVTMTVIAVADTVAVVIG